jgi:hypothetical protein
VGNLFDAERFSEVTYANLRDKKNGVDQNGEEMATGAYNLALVIYKQKGDLIKAEMLARESFRIMTLKFGSDNHIFGATCDLLARILQAQGKIGDERLELFQRVLAVPLRN